MPILLSDKEIDCLPISLDTNRLIAEAFGIEPDRTTWELFAADEQSSAGSFDYKHQADQFLANELTRSPNTIFADFHVGPRQHFPLFTYRLDAAFTLTRPNWFWRTEEFQTAVHAAVEVFNRQDLLFVVASAVNFGDTEGDRVRAIAVARSRTALKALRRLQQATLKTDK